MAMKISLPAFVLAIAGTLLPCALRETMAQTYEGDLGAQSAELGYVSLVDEVSLDDVEDEFDDNAEIEAAGDGSKCCDTCGTGLVYGGFEFTSLFPYGSEYVEVHSHNGLQNLPHIPHHGHPEGNPFDLTRPVGYRVWAGAENCCGQGVRVIYWQWEDEANFRDFDFDGDLDPESIDREIDIWTIDVEGTQSMCYCDTTFIGSLGARLANFEYNSNHLEVATVNPLQNSFSQDFTGVGITGAIEARRPMIWCLEGFAKLRGSLLFGDSNFGWEAHNYDIFDDVDIDISIAGEVQYQTFMVWETQVGVERHFCTGLGTFFVRGAFEAQLWEVPPVVGVGDMNLGLVGAAFGAGLSR
jgi:hypothetical protein